MPFAQPISAVDAAGAAHRPINLNGLGLDWAAGRQSLDASGNLYPPAIGINTAAPGDFIDIEQCNNGGITIASVDGFAHLVLSSYTNLFQLATCGIGYPPLTGCCYLYSANNPGASGLNVFTANARGDLAFGQQTSSGVAVDDTLTLQSGGVLYVISNVDGPYNWGVGIGTNAPAYQLDVAGVTYSSQGYQLPDYTTITAPTEGLIAWDFGNHTLKSFNGTNWQ